MREARKLKLATEFLTTLLVVSMPYLIEMRGSDYNNIDDAPTKNPVIDPPGLFFSPYSSLATTAIQPNNDLYRIDADFLNKK